MSEVTTGYGEGVTQFLGSMPHMAADRERVLERYRAALGEGRPADIPALWDVADELGLDTERVLSDLRAIWRVAELRGLIQKNEDLVRAAAARGRLAHEIADEIEANNGYVREHARLVAAHPRVFPIDGRYQDKGGNIRDMRGPTPQPPPAGSVNHYLNQTPLGQSILAERGGK